MLRLDGRKDPDRRDLLAHDNSAVEIIGASTGTRPSQTYGPFREYRKTQATYAVRLEEPFEVETLEGLHRGKAGDYLAVGAHGEMYPIDAAVFEDTYEEAS